MEKFEKEPDIIGISKSRSGGSIWLDPTEKVSTETGKRVQNCPEF